MKKVMTIFIFTILLFGIMGFALAQTDTNNSGSISNDNSIEDNSNSDRSEIRERVRDGEVEREFRREIRTADGKKIEVERKIKIKGGETEIKTRLKVEGTGSNFSVVDSQGERHRVRVTPERLRTLMIERLKANNITEFSIEEIEHENIPKVVFKANSEHPGRFLGVFKLSVKAETQVDPETGEIVDVNTPWWVFLVSGDQITDANIVGNETLEDDLIADEEELEEEFDDVEVEEELEIEAETLNGSSEIKIELEFETDAGNTEAVIDEVLGKLTLTSEEIDEFLEIETSDEALDNEEEIEFEIEFEDDGITEAEFELRFFVESDSREVIVDAIMERLSSLDSESLSNIVEVESDGENDLEDEADEEESNEIEIDLIEENDSGESGEAELEEENGQVTVKISMTGFAQDVSQPAHIHTGECPDVGEIVYPLENIVNGESETTLNVTLEQLQSESPLGINIHKSVEEASVYTACGDLEFE